MKVSRLTPRFTIERLRTVVLIGGGILVAAIAVFLLAGQWKLRKYIKDIPGKLGVDIQQSANGVDYTQSRKGKTLFKIHAARAVQIKSTGKSLLHDVHIDLYGEDGKRADTISGSEFEYDPAAGIAHAPGTVEITMMRPGARPAIAQLKPQFKPNPVSATPVPSTMTANSAITDNEIHITTSGLTFNQKTGVAVTDQRVDFAVRQGKGNAIGAVYNSQSGQLVLDHAVELTVNSMATHSAGPVTVHAVHAEFERTQQLCFLTQAQAHYSGGDAQAAQGRLHFREDGTIEEIVGDGGVDLRSAGGAHVTAPHGVLDFDKDNHPRVGDLTGGTRLSMNGTPRQPGREVDGTAPSAHLVFNGKGDLHQAHLERGVLFHTHQKGMSAKGVPIESDRRWSSATADVDFAPSESATPHARAKSATGHTEPRLVRGFGGVVVTSESTTGGHTTPAKLSADTVTAELAPRSVLTHLIGNGHAYFEQETAQGAHQSSSSDQLDVHFTPTEPGKPQASPTVPRAQGASAQTANIETMHQSGHVVLIQTPAAKPASAGGHDSTNQPANQASTNQASTNQAPMRATAENADYDGKTEILHLTGSPRVQQGALDLTAQSIDFTRSTGDAFAHGDVRASWSNAGTQNASANPGANTLPGASLLASGSASGLSGKPDAGAGTRNNGPVHAIAGEAELRQATQEIFFRAGQGSAQQARLWQAGNSVSAPLILLNRQKMTLVAQTSSAASPVRTVLVSNPPAAKSSVSGNAGAGANSSAQASSAGQSPAGQASSSKSPTTIRMRSGDLHYSEGERLALFHAGVLGSVTAETYENGSPATIVAQQTEVHLTPAGTQSGAGGAAHRNAGSASGSASVDRMIAQDHVSVDFPDRRGTGERLVYLSEDGTFTLTGTGSNPPRMTDTERGTVTGAALVYHSRDRSVSAEGRGAKTSTETHSSK